MAFAPADFLPAARIPARDGARPAARLRSGGTAQPGAPASALTPAGPGRILIARGELDLPVMACLPVRNEAASIEPCLGALSASLAALAEPAGILLLVNNTTDGTAEIGHAFARRHDLALVLVESDLPPAMSGAGHARRLALDIGAALAAPDAVLLTTDADALVEPDWARRLVDAVRGGAALACGAIAPDAGSLAALPPPVRALERVEGALYAAQARLWQRITPGASHALGVRACGAAMAISAARYRTAGPLPAVSSGEDRLLARRFVTLDESVAYVDAARAAVSCRLDGRAEGGMAGTLARRVAGDLRCDDALMPTAAFAERALLWRHLSGAADGTARLARRIGLAPRALGAAPQGLRGARWLRLLARLPRLAPMTLPAATRELARAEALLDALPIEAPGTSLVLDALDLFAPSPTPVHRHG